MGGPEHVGGTARRGVGRVLALILALILVLFLSGAVWATATRAGATRSHTTRAARIRRGPTMVPRSVPPIIPTATPIAPSSAAPPRPAARPRGAKPAGPSTLLRATTYQPGWDIARDIAITADGAGYLVLDGLGGVHKVGTATRLDRSLPYRGTDVAQRLVVSPTGAGFGVLDRDGTLSLTGDIRPPAQAATTEDDWVGAAPTATGWVVVGRDRREVNWGWRSR